MSKKVYIRVDKPIEAGDLVRCVRGDIHHSEGQVRKVLETDVNCDGISLIGCNKFHLSKSWEPVHKLKVGDRVVFGGKDILTVKELSPDAEQLTVKLGYAEFKLFVTDQFELYQPEKHEPKPDADAIQRLTEPREISISIDPADKKKLLAHLGYMSRRSDMKREVAEMIVELLDTDDKENCPQSSVLISNWREFDNTVTALSNGNEYHAATLSPSDTWDTLTGVYVALSKATGRKLPDWIYGEGK